MNVVYTCSFIITYVVCLPLKLKFYESIIELAIKTEMDNFSSLFLLSLLFRRKIKKKKSWELNIYKTFWGFFLDKEIK